MASATDADIFGETGISPGVSVNSAGFFAQHGIFYVTDPEIGRLVEEIDNEGLSKNPEALARCKVQLLRNPVSQTNSDIQFILLIILAY